jgi:hypothetical protein
MPLPLPTLNPFPWFHAHFAEAIARDPRIQLRTDREQVGAGDERPETWVKDWRAPAGFEPTTLGS